MKQYLAIYFGGATKSEKSVPLDEEVQKEFMNAWVKWAKTYKDSIVDVGCPLGRAKVANHAGVHDKGNSMTAYSIVHAESHEEAASIFSEHPHLSLHDDNAIEIIEMKPLPK